MDAPLRLKAACHVGDGRIEGGRKIYYSENEAFSMHDDDVKPLSGYDDIAVYRSM